MALGHLALSISICLLRWGFGSLLNQAIVKTSEIRHPVFLARNIGKYYFLKKSFFSFLQLFNPMPGNSTVG